MDRRSITKEYYMLAVNENGYMPSMSKEAANVGLVAAGITELLLNGIITAEKRRITVANDLPGDLNYLMPLYDYLREKVRSTNKIMSDYIASTGSRLRQLTEGIGKALLEEHKVTKDTGGLFGNKAVYIPEESCREEIVLHIKSVITDGSDMSLHDAALVSILKKSWNLHRYFSGSEKTALKAKLKELKNDPDGSQLQKMIDYLTEELSGGIWLLLLFFGFPR